MAKIDVPIQTHECTEALQTLQQWFESGGIVDCKLEGGIMKVVPSEKLNKVLEIIRD